MRRRTTSLAIVAALTAAIPAHAQAPTRQEYIEATGRPKPVPEVPRALRSIVVEATAERLVVLGLAGQRIVVDIGWDEPTRFLTFYDGRYLGFEFGGYETFGFVLIDRQMEGEAAIIETGAEPQFSSDGRHFAAVEVSESAWGNLNGAAIWEILPERTVQRLFVNALPSGQHWRLDRWVSPDCVAFSAVELTWQPAADQEYERAVLEAPHQHYGIELGERIALRAYHDRPGCTPDEDAGDG